MESTASQKPRPHRHRHNERLHGVELVAPQGSVLRLEGASDLFRQASVFWINQMLETVRIQSMGIEIIEEAAKLASTHAYKKTSLRRIVWETTARRSDREPRPCERNFVRFKRLHHFSSAEFRMYVIVEENPNCAPDERVFPTFGAARSVSQVQTDLPTGGTGGCDVTGVDENRRLLFGPGATSGRFERRRGVACVSAACGDCGYGGPRREARGRSTIKTSGAYRFWFWIRA